MPANRIIEMPLPTPFWLICSPIHMMSAVPAVNARMMITAEKTAEKPSLYSVTPLFLRKK